MISSYDSESILQVSRLKRSILTMRMTWFRTWKYQIHQNDICSSMTTCRQERNMRSRPCRECRISGRAPFMPQHSTEAFIESSRRWFSTLIVYNSTSRAWANHCGNIIGCRGRRWIQSVTENPDRPRRLLLTTVPAVRTRVKVAAAVDIIGFDIWFAQKRIV